jgi:hypothetical protein
MFYASKRSNFLFYELIDGLSLTTRHFDLIMECMGIRIFVRILSWIGFEILSVLLIISFCCINLSFITRVSGCAIRVISRRLALSVFTLLDCLGLLMFFTISFGFFVFFIESVNSNHFS